MVDLAAEPQRPSPVVSRRRRWPLVLVAFAVVLVAAGVSTAVWFAHWRGSFRPLASYPVAGARTPVAAGHTLYFDDMVDYSRVFDHPDHPGTLTLHISAIRAVIRENTAAATVTVEKCELSSEGHRLLGQPASFARARCATLSPFHAGTVKLGYDPGDVDIVVAVQPKHEGVADVHGVQLSFTAGWRYGTQHAGVQATTITR